MFYKRQAFLYTCKARVDCISSEQECAGCPLPQGKAVTTEICTATGLFLGKLYKEANCFFTHHLRQNCATVNYGYIDVQNRRIVFDGAPQAWDYDWYGGAEHRQGAFSLRRYLECLIAAQNATICDADEADVVLVMGKAHSEKEVSLADTNFFMDPA